MKQDHNSFGEHNEYYYSWTFLIMNYLKHIICLDFYYG